MNKSLLVALFLLSSSSCLSQIHFEKGYFIELNGLKTECFIRNVDWRNNPSKFDYKLSENSDEVKTETSSNVKEFGVEHTFKFVRESVDIDRSKQVVRYMSSERNPEFNMETLFLKVIVDGEADLYEFRDESNEAYFFSVGSSKPVQLIHKQYKVDDSRIETNNTFRQQLFSALSCADITISDLQKVDYRTNQLKILFIKFNTCRKTTYINYSPKRSNLKFNLNVRPGISLSGLSVGNSVSKSFDATFPSNVSFRFGLENELTLPFNKNKWSVIVEPTYRYYNSETTNKSGNFKVNYHSIEIPIGIRYYMFLNDRSKLFLNAAITLDYATGSTVSFERVSSQSIDLSSSVNYGFGLGYKFVDRYGLEFRYYTTRNVASDYLYYKCGYNSMSIIASYALFKPKPQ